MYQQTNTLVLQPTVTKQDYIELLDKVVGVAKAFNNNRLHRATISAIYYYLPDEFSSYYLDLAFSLRLREDKIHVLTTIFDNLTDEKKALVREEIKKTFSKIKKQETKINFLYKIFNTKDKELILHLCNKVLALPSKYLLKKSLYLLDIANCSDEVTAKELQSQALSEVLKLSDSKVVFWYLKCLFDRGLLGEAKQKAIDYATENWPRLVCSFDKKLYLSEILKYFPAEAAQRIGNELYQRIKKINKNRTDKTTELEMLMRLADKLDNSPQALFLYKEAISLVRQLDSSNKIKINTINSLALRIAPGLALEFAELILEKYSFDADNTEPTVLADWLIDILPKIPKENLIDIIHELNFPMMFLEATGQVNAYISRSLKILPFLPTKDQETTSSKILDLLLEYRDEKGQAENFGELANYLSQENKEKLLNVINQMRSTKHKATALANVLEAFEGTDFICLAEKVLELINLSLDERHMHLLIWGLVQSIGQKLESSTKDLKPLYAAFGYFF